MASSGGLSEDSSVTGIGSPYAAPTTWTLWGAAAVVAAGYGVFLVVVALQSPAGAELTGRFGAQPAVKALAAVLLAAAALTHPLRRERRWLVPALLFSAAGDFLLAMPWWEPSFVLGLGAFLVAHLCFLTALWPLRGAAPARVAVAVVVCVACVTLLIWFWPRLTADGLTVPVVAYMAVLGAMVCAALLAELPTPWTALGAVCFAVSDGMIGIGRFVLDAGAGLPATSNSEALAVPIWWAYAASLLLITAGLFFGRNGSSELSVTQPT
ncbi:lysoplasmalogenase [Mycobacterium yunnanensis]|uniref:Lysoplasmalogenase n=1 Tax=Mycobacterium yunnanensis TaxID=368477 RepID=A0A9X3BUP7_9MYCO|nr:lysoplasmalogenase [Mycobacterium yunnanensis]MCV7422929.1 lysoplasmalogenase [Mycobacterium yunnanensis]